MTIDREWVVGNSRTIIHTFTNDEIHAFANLTGDENPLHVDSDYAERTSAGGQVVHGMLAASFVSTLIGMHLPGPGALWNSFQVNWRKMIRIGDTLQFKAEVIAVQAGTQTLDLKIEGIHVGNNEVYLDATARVSLMTQKKKDTLINLGDQRILVTGASGAVGQAICRKLVKQGANVVAWGRNLDRLQSLQTELSEDNCIIQVVDLLDTKAITDALQIVLKNGNVSSFVHAAAAPLNYLSVDDPSNQIELATHWMIGVAAFQQIAQTLVKKMCAGNAIVAILTQAILDQPPTKMSAYIAAKAACWGLVRSFAVECGPRGIRCNAISPNMMDTPYTANMSVRAKQVEAASNPLRRLCRPEDVADVAAFLLDSESGYINGVNLPVTGGSKMPS